MSNDMRYLRGSLGDKIGCCPYNVRRCAVTIARILKFIGRDNPNIPITICLNGSGCPEVSASVSNINLKVNGNAPVTGSTKAQAVSLDLTGATATGSISALQVSGKTAEKTISIPVEVSGEIPVTIESSGSITIPELDIECTTADTDRGDSAQQSSSCVSCNQEDHCCEYFCHTVSKDVDVNVSGTTNAEVDIDTTAEALIPQLDVTGTTAVTPISLAVAGTSTGTLQPLEATGTATTNGLHVTGTIDISTEVKCISKCFTGRIRFVNCDIVVLIEEETNKRITLCISDILKIKIHHHICEEYIREMREKDVDYEYKSTCSKFIEESLKNDICKVGLIEFYGKNTGNSIGAPIDTRNIYAVTGGILYEVSNSYCYEMKDTIYSLCNIAGYSFNEITG
jgi:hypothetical protein